MLTRLTLIFLATMAIRTIKTLQKINEYEGRKPIAAILIGIDTLLFLLVLKDILSSEVTIPIVLSMAFGYISGYFIGTVIEEKLALGKVLVTIKISKKYSKELHRRLKESGFVFIRTKRVYTHKNKLKKIYQGIIYRKELPKLKRILSDLKLVAYVSPIKYHFGSRIVTTEEYLRDQKRISQ
ncbi:MAG: hypothetical protein J7L43_01925 [Candidatus Aenigmarchaeota archaeon]|nr:hypothetical protein [Candidatus Aenigmarchaeota archaeon]